jgi:hypothetical protein
METKDIIILTALFAVSGYSLYRKYLKKKGIEAPGRSQRSFTAKSSIRDQADDYEPYSGGRKSEG